MGDFRVTIPNDPMVEDTVSLRAYIEAMRRALQEVQAELRRLEEKKKDK